MEMPVGGIKSNPKGPSVFIVTVLGKLRERNFIFAFLNVFSQPMPVSRRVHAAKVDMVWTHPGMPMAGGIVLGCLVAARAGRALVQCTRVGITSKKYTGTNPNSGPKAEHA